ncbi:MAG: conjugative transfer system coupling protein TraD [Candidatus Thiodiazotropha lotti]|nr:conjugative transfer system coupling protein TraD [Candidatus Thiodiazotropha lotti]
MSSNIIENPYRPTYEAISASTWLLAAGITQMMPMVPALLAVVGGVAATAFGLLRGWQAYRIGDNKARLSDGGMEFISPDKMKKKVQSVSERGEIWLGTGFDWGAEEANRLSHVMGDLQGLVSKRDLRDGNYWIHGVGEKEEEITMPLVNLNGQSLLVGTTRAGKTRFLDLMIMQAIGRGESVVIFDPKGDRDLENSAKRACRLYGKPELFARFHPAFPENSCKIDPMKNWNRPTELASRLAALVPSETGADPFTAFAWQAINNVCQGLLLINERPNLVTIRRLVEGGLDSLLIQVLRTHLSRTVPDWADGYPGRLKRARNNEVDALIGIYKAAGADVADSRIDGMLTAYQHNREHFQKMIANLIPILGMLTSPPLDKLLSPEVDLDDPRETLDMASAIRRGRVIYVGLDSLSDNTVGSAIGSIFLADLVAVAGDEYNYGRCEQPVNLFVDEAAEIINKPMIQLLNKGGGALFRSTLATQTFADFAARLGDENQAHQVLANCNNVYALRTIDSNTQEYLAESIPEVDIRKVETQYRHGAQGADWVNGFNGMTGETLASEKESMFPAPLFGQLPALHYFARLSGGRFVKGKIPILSDEE